MAKTKAFTAHTKLNMLAQNTHIEILNTLEKVYTTVVAEIIEKKPTNEAAKIITSYILGAALVNAKYKEGTFKFLTDSCITQPELIQYYFELQKLSNTSASEQAIFLKAYDTARAGGYGQQQKAAIKKSEREAVCFEILNELCDERSKIDELTSDLMVQYNTKNSKAIPFSAAKNIAKKWLAQK